MTDEDAILAANQAFYEAFANRDIEAMQRLWSEAMPVVCIHPGWDALSGRQVVLQSWAGIFANPASPDIRCHDPQVFVQGDMAFVVCYEEIQGGFLIATNIPNLISQRATNHGSNLVLTLNSLGFLLVFAVLNNDAVRQIAWMCFALTGIHAVLCWMAFQRLSAGDRLGRVNLALVDGDPLVISERQYCVVIYDLS